MKILVVGTVPPPGGDGARGLARAIGTLIADGHEVEVLSPDSRSAAHRQAQLTGPLLAVQLVLNARRFDGLLLRIEPDLPLASDSGRVSRTVALGLCGLALQLWKNITIRLDAPAPIPGGVGGRATRGLWARADRIVVGSEEDRLSLLRAEGVSADRVVVEEPLAPSTTAERSGWTIDDGRPVREEVLALVRSRAARERQVNSARLELGATGIGPDAASAFSASEHLAPSIVGLARLGYERARRAAGSLSGRSSR